MQVAITTPALFTSNANCCVLISIAANKLILAEENLYQANRQVESGCLGNAGQQREIVQLLKDSIARLAAQIATS